METCVFIEDGLFQSEGNQAKFEFPPYNAIEFSAASLATDGTYCEDPVAEEIGGTFESVIRCQDYPDATVHGAFTLPLNYSSSHFYFEVVGITTTGVLDRYRMIFSCLCAGANERVDGIYQPPAPDSFASVDSAVTVPILPVSIYTGPVACTGGCWPGRTVFWRGKLDALHSSSPYDLGVQAVKVRYKTSGSEDRP